MMNLNPASSGLNLLLNRIFFLLILAQFISCSKSFEEKMNFEDSQGRQTRLELITPLDNSSIYSENVSITGYSQDKGGIEKVEIYLNNNPISLGPISGQWTKNLQLSIGENKIFLRLKNSKGDFFKTSPIYLYRLWEKVGELPTPISQSNVAYIEGNYYLFGGWTFQWSFLPAMDNHWKYNPLTRQSTEIKPTLIHPCYSSLIAYHNNLIYIIGGLKKSNRIDYARNDTIDTYDKDGLMKGTLPIVESIYLRGAAANAQIGNIVYQIGGINNDGDTLDSITQYNLETNQWQLIGTFDKKIKYAAAIVHENKIYIFGGQDHNGNFIKSVFIFDPLSKGIVTFNDRLKFSRAGLSAIKINSKVYLMGGQITNTSNQTEYLDNVEVFDLISQSSKELRKMPSKLSFMSAETDGNKITVFGGIDGEDFPTKNWIYEYYPQLDNLN